MKRGIVAFSFAQEKIEPSPCNFRLAEAVKRIVEAEEGELVIISQWEVAIKLIKDGIKVTHVVEPLLDWSYLDSVDVWAEARLYFAHLEIEEVVIVANPFIHAYAIERMIRKDGFKICQQYDTTIGRIGFDSQSLQWWTRGPLRLLLYSALSAVGLAKYFRG
ncbi:MAG: hypothetical protein WCI63_02455 [bacterium]